MSEESDLLIDELISAAIAFGRGQLPDWQTRITAAEAKLREYVEELETKEVKE